MAEEPQPLELVQLRAAWVGVEELPIMFVNQAIAQVDDHGDVIVTFGQASPPVILGGTPEERRREIEAVQFVQIRPVARVSMSTRRIQEVINALQQTLANQEKARTQLEKGGES
jgi:hypothetical protein